MRRAPFTKSWAAACVVKDSGGSGGAHEVIHSRTTAELLHRTEIGQTLSLSRRCTAGASLASALSFLGHFADVNNNNDCLC